MFKQFSKSNIKGYWNNSNKRWSKDSSLDIMQKFAENYKGKVKVIDSKNGGAGSARNKGLDIATGEFIKFVDADDYLRLDILERMYTLAKENKIKLLENIKIHLK